jgi:hemoglobin
VCKESLIKDAYHILHLATKLLKYEYEIHLKRVWVMKASEHAYQARAHKMQEALSNGIDDAFISQLVERFYAAIREDELLGPIFAKHIEDWPNHLARMKDFWASIMLESGRYSGNPMQKHIAIGGLDALHFARWHGLWDRTLADVAPSPLVAGRFRDAATRIGESLLTGIEIDRGGLSALSARPGGPREWAPRTQVPTNQGR